MRTLIPLPLGAVLACCFVGALGGPAWAGRPFEEGFRGIKWEAKCSEVPGFKEFWPDRATDVAKMYVRPEEKKARQDVASEHIVAHLVRARAMGGLLTGAAVALLLLVNKLRTQPGDGSSWNSKRVPSASFAEMSMFCQEF